MVWLAVGGGLRSHRSARVADCTHIPLSATHGKSLKLCCFHCPFIAPRWLFWDSAYVLIPSRDMSCWGQRITSFWKSYHAQVPQALEPSLWVKRYQLNPPLCKTFLKVQSDLAWPILSFFERFCRLQGAGASPGIKLGMGISLLHDSQGQHIHLALACRYLLHTMVNVPITTGIHKTDHDNLHISSATWQSLINHFSSDNIEELSRGRSNFADSKGIWAVIRLKHSDQRLKKICQMLYIIKYES